MKNMFVILLRAHLVSHYNSHRKAL